MLNDPYFLAVLSVLIVLGVVNSVLLLHGSIAIKRLWHPRLVIFIGVCMVALAYIQAPIPKTLYFSIPAYAVICWVYLRCVAFCPACGKEVYRLSGLTKGRFSCRCGTEFSKAPQGVT